MRLRPLLVGVIIVATAAFVTGVALERNAEDEHHPEAGNATPAESAESEATHADEGGESAEEGAKSEGAPAEEGEGKRADPSDEEEGDATVLGVDLESTPLVVLAALASLGLALATWVRPGWVLLLVAIAVAMVAFAALDVREVIHQLDENREGLAVLAAAVAALHLGAAVVALTMGRRPSAAAA